MLEKFLKNKSLILLILSSLYASLYLAYENVPDKKSHIYFLDVGQGDSIFIKTPKNHQILIDGGPKNKVLEELSEVMPFFDKSIDLLILTHPHADHVDGLVEVLKRYSVNNVLFTGVNYNNPSYEEFLKEIDLQKINYFIADSKTDFKFDDVFLDVMYPEKQLVNNNFSNVNNSSVAMRIIVNGKTMLLTGDLEKGIEKKLLDKNLNLKADIFKAGHHGSKTSSTWKFLQRVRPVLAVIQVGKNNKFGHPHVETLENFAKIGVKKVYRNDLNGRIDINF